MGVLLFSALLPRGQYLLWVGLHLLGQEAKTVKTVDSQYRHQLVGCKVVAEVAEETERRRRVVEMVD